MTDTIQPFHRITDTPESASGQSWRTLRLMLIHFTLAGLALLLGALVILGLLYADLSKIELSAGLRIVDPGDIYERETQVKLALAAALALLSLIPFRAVRRLGEHRRSGIGVARVSALLLLAGFPASFIAWRMVANLPDDAGDMTTAQQVIDELSIGVLILAGLLLVQAGLALWYQVWLTLPAVRAQLVADDPAANPLPGRVRRAAIGFWLAVMIGLGVILGVLTDWLYEIPVTRPDPGELLYATSFNSYNDEWDLYPGRDAAQVVSSSEVQLANTGGDVAPLTGNMLWIKYGSGNADEVISSPLDRKFSDLDLRVAVQQIAGPAEESQFGVAFRYRDAENTFVFRISGDGYYSLDKVKDGSREIISDWNVTETIRPGSLPNEIRVVARGDEFRFFVNGQPMPLCLKGQN